MKLSEREVGFWLHAPSPAMQYKAYQLTFNKTGFIEAEVLPVKAVKLPSGSVWKVRAEPIDFGKKDGPLAWSLICSILP